MMPPLQTETISVDHRNPDLAVLQRAAALIRRGRLVAFPTETVYGLGANAVDAEAAARIFAAKERPPTDPLIVHVSEADQVDALTRDIPPSARALMRQFWPGPLTLVLPKSPVVPPVVTAGMDTVAIRMPDNPIALGLIQTAGVPIAAPSANRFGRPSPTTAQHVLADLDGRVDLVLDGGPTEIGVESTVLDLTSGIPTVLRPGGLTLEMLQQVLPHVGIRPGYLLPSGQGASSPGQMLRHYAPSAYMIVFRGDSEAGIGETIRRYAKAALARGERVGILCPTESVAMYSDLAITIGDLGSQRNLAASASRLFACLRDLDTTPVDVILAHEPPPTELGLAIRDRLFRAAEGRLVET